jgi:nitroreductase
MNQPTTLDALLRARYGSTSPGSPHAADSGDMDRPHDGTDATIAVLLGHRSVRRYTSEGVSAKALDLMLAAAQSASTSSNLQTWSVVAVEDPAAKARLAKLAGDQRHVRECPLFLVWLADLARLDAMGERRGLPRAGLDYLELMMVGLIDAALASQNAAVAAEALGLGIVYIGGIRNQPEAVTAELGLPPRTVAVFGMCVGHPDAAFPVDIKPRLPPAAILHRERYDAVAIVEPIDRYVATMSDFYVAHQMKTNGDWAQHSLNRVRGPAALQGRDRLGEALKALGFLGR